MKVKIVLNIEEPDYLDEEHSTGLSEEGFNALMDAIAHVGDIEDGPDKVEK